MGETFETIIVGMGPAGMAAAIELCRYGVQVAVVDENPLAGGQVYRRLPKEFIAADERSLGPNFTRGKRLINEFKEIETQCELFNDAYVWGGFDDHRLALRQGDNITLLKYKKLLLAEGASERPAVFPGWTLPGVMTLGGVQKLVTRELFLPGKRFLIAGASPLLIPVAADLLKAGGELVAICTIIPVTRFLKLTSEVVLQKDIFAETVSYCFEIARHKVAVFSRYTVVSCTGKDRVERVTIAKLDEEGRSISSSERTIEIDILGASNGILPMSRLARLLGCQHEFDTIGLYWKVKTQPLFRSSLPDVYAAGDSQDIGGRDLAEMNGRLAGLEIAKDLGRISAHEFNMRARANARRRGQLQKYVSALKRVLSRNINELGTMDLDTIVCRCEQVSLREVLSGIEKGYRNINEIKRTRVGMGLCQGRICESIISEIMMKKGIPIEEIGYFGIRPPISPVPISLLHGYAKQIAQGK